PFYEHERTGVYYNPAVVIENDGTVVGKYRKTHIPHVGPCFWEKFYFKPGNLGYPVWNTSVGRVGLLICYDRHFPEPARELGLKGASWSSTRLRRSSRSRVICGSSSSRPMRWRTATGSAPSIGSGWKNRSTRRSSTARATSATHADGSSARPPRRRTKSWCAISTWT